MKKHVFFDLDNTLWDFDASSMLAFERLFEDFHLINYKIASAQQFHDAYMGYNERLWELYRQGEVDKAFLKKERFRLPLHDFGVDDESLAYEIGEHYTYWSPRLVALVPHAIELLEHLRPDNGIHLITNGFAEVQNVKIKESGIDRYIDTMTVSEEIGIKKPDPRIFMYALEKACANAKDSLMVGDDLQVDVLPAKAVGMRQCFFNRKGISHNEDIDMEIKDLAELMFYNKG